MSSDLSSNPLPDESLTIRQLILEKVAARGSDKSICPSEVARDLGGDDWRSHMDSVRRVGADLLEAGEIEVLQKGQPVHPLTARGPIRFKLPQRRSPSM